jgi:hypothetical protein
MTLFLMITEGNKKKGRALKTLPLKVVLVG